MPGDYRDRGLQVGGLSFDGGRIKFTVAVRDGRKCLIISGDRDRSTPIIFDLGPINIAPSAGDPTNPQDGDIWYDDTAGLFQFRQEGVTESLSGDDAPVGATYVVISADATLTAELVLGTDVIMAGLAAARPAAGTAGRLYLETNTNGGTLFRDNGAAWVQVADSVTQTSSGHTIRENGVDQTTRTGLNFIDADAGAGLITDDAVGDETEVNLSLYRLEAADHSHQSAGLQGGQLDHGLALTGLTDDDHTQYLPVSGARAMTGDLDMGGNDIFNVRNMYPDPGGRLCLTTATPVHVADAANQTTIFYALYKHDLVPIFDGTNWDVFRLTELSIAMAASANWAANSNYDLFIINDAGTLRLATGTAWTNGTTRSADTIERLNGRWVNSTTHTMRYGAASTVSVTAQRGTYVGTMRTTGTAGTTTMEFGGEALNGDPGFLYLWNMYNRVPASIQSLDDTDSWTYATAAWRSANASTTNRVSFVRGLDEDSVHAVYDAVVNPGGAQNAVLSIGLDSTTAPATGAAMNIAIQGVTAGGNRAHYVGYPGLGLHFLQALEYQSAGTGTYYGDFAVTWLQGAGLLVNTLV